MKINEKRCEGKRKRRRERIYEEEGLAFACDLGSVEDCRNVYLLYCGRRFSHIRRALSHHDAPPFVATWRAIALIARPMTLEARRAGLISGLPGLNSGHPEWIAGQNGLMSGKLKTDA